MKRFATLVAAGAALLAAAGCGDASRATTAPAAPTAQVSDPTVLTPYVPEVLPGPRSMSAPHANMNASAAAATQVLVYGDYPSGSSAASALSSLGLAVTHVSTLPADLSPYKVIYNVSAFTAISAADQVRLAAFVQSGHGLFLTGERPCCETLNSSVQQFLRSVLDPQDVIQVGGQGDASGYSFSFNSGAMAGIALTPNTLGAWVPSASGVISGLLPFQVLAQGTTGQAVAAAFDSQDIIGGNGRIVVMMDVNWWDNLSQGSNRPAVENIEYYLEHGTAVINQPPTAAPGGPYTGVEGAAVQFDGSSSSDPDHDAITYAWNFGDGSTASVATPTHAYADNGAYTVSLTVTDAAGHATTQTTTATITNAAPAITSINPATSIPVGGTFNLAGVFSDAGVNDGSWHVAIDWGDHTTGTVIATAQGAFSASHVYANFGSYTVSVTVTDKDGTVSTASTVVVSTTDTTAPVITEVVGGTAGTNGWFTGDVVVNWTVTDPESGIATQTGCDNLTLSSNTPEAGTTYTCTAKNGAGLTSTKSVVVKRDASKPTVQSTVSGAHNGEWYTGTATVTWTVTANGGSGVTYNCPAVSQTSDTQGATFSCTATSGAGLTTTANVVVKRDATPASITASVNGPQGNNGWYVGDVQISWNVVDAISGVATSNGCATVTASTDNSGTTYTCSAVNGAGLSSQQSVSVKRDATKPVITYTGNAGSYTVDQTIAITCSATDAMSGIASSTCANVSGAAYTFAATNAFSASATDKAGNVGTASTSFTVSVTQTSLCNLVRRFVSQNGVANSMCVKITQASYGALRNELSAQSGKAISANDAAILLRLVDVLDPQ